MYIALVNGHKDVLELLKTYNYDVPSNKLKPHLANQFNNHISISGTNRTRPVPNELIIPTIQIDSPLSDTVIDFTFSPNPQEVKKNNFESPRNYFARKR